VAGGAPFGEEESAELRRLARTLFKLRNGTLPLEQRDAMTRWGVWVDAFLASANPMSGAIQHLPYEGGVMDQPARTMSVWRLLQSEFIEAMPKGDGITERIRGG
jgi:hypothetical protein